jgi:hypothetical protein
MKNKSYEGIWIPAETLNDSELTLHQKLVLAMINNLSTDTEPCFASNEYFGKILGISAKNVSVHINNLKHMGKVTTYLQRNEKAQVVRREIRPTYHLPESGVGYPRNRGEGIPEIVNQLSDENLLNDIGEDIIKDSKDYNKNYNKDDSVYEIDSSTKKTKKEKVFKDEEGLFELFWKTIPPLRRINKSRTKKEWKLAVHKESVGKIQESMELFVERVEPKFIKTSYNWLKEERWKAVPEESKKRGAFEYR